MALSGGTDDAEIQLPRVKAIGSLADQKARNREPASVGALVNNRHRVGKRSRHIKVTACAEASRHLSFRTETRKPIRQGPGEIRLSPVAANDANARAFGIFLVGMRPLVIVVHHTNRRLRAGGERQA